MMMILILQEVRGAHTHASALKLIPQFGWVHNTGRVTSDLRGMANLSFREAEEENKDTRRLEVYPWYPILISGFSSSKSLIVSLFNFITKLFLVFQPECLSVDSV